ncbi:GNAT family N-acetyltransferase [Undibacterium flavidum]|uniref:GNAT family N-acetyltransferase n=1 Tax=Undibacterium flavidum TaxID=2762297 RepID=A0ABR6YBL2_9BURK|nr:N-acetyltransferase [Undibacterium flavidum]MBC3873930.1 GNAT family N-acetyltransferase [Undibacterium flavidum]
MIQIRTATSEDFEQIWPIFRAVVAAGETYTYPRDTNKEQAKQLWMNTPRQTLVAEEDGKILGSYFIKTNQTGSGDHVCNCGYMVSPEARGRGLARLMCEHSQALAVTLGYRAMQFNFVVSSNEVAVRLWTKLGFETVGRLPRAFRHPLLDDVDALVMYKWLTE